MELSFSTQQTAIFLNETDFITPYLKPSNNFSLHGDKIQSAYRLQGKAWMICNLSLFGLLFTTSQTYLSLGLKAFVLALFCSYSLSPNLCMMVCFLSFSSQLKWQCLRVAFPNYPWPKHDPPITLPTCSYFYFFKALISINHLFVTMLIIYLDLLEHKVCVQRHSSFITVAPSPLPYKPVP